MQALPVTSPSSPAPRRDEGPDLQDGRFGAVMASFLPFQAAPAPEAPVVREATQAPESTDPSPRRELARRTERGQFAAKAPHQVQEQAQAKAPEMPEGAPANAKPEPMAPTQGPERFPPAEKAQGPGAISEARPTAPFAPAPLPIPTQAALPETLPPTSAPAQAPAQGLIAVDLPPAGTSALEVDPSGASAAPRSPAVPHGAATPPPVPDITLSLGAAPEANKLPAPAPEAEVASGPSLPPTTPGSATLPPSPLAPPQTSQPTEVPPPKAPFPPKGAPSLAASGPAQLAAVPSGSPSAGSGSDASLLEEGGQPPAQSEGEGTRPRPVSGRAFTEEAPRTSEPQKPFAPEPIPHRVEAARPETPKAEGPKFQVQPGFTRDLALAMPTVAPAVSPSAEMKASSSPVVNQVEGTLRWMVKGAVPEARLQLHPESLGKVSIELKLEDGQVHAKVWVQDPAAMQALQDGRASLEQALKQSGLQLGSFDLQQGGDASRQAPEPNSHHLMSRKEDPTLPTARQEAPPVGGPRPANSRRIELYA
ncbi:MAG: flagellar hook-length control protein FliK [Acidobacteria bacterium]|nr:flagellar hook-length control protein FliK [Acidobacteriota bacterium]